MARLRFLPWILSELSSLRDGDLAVASRPTDTLLLWSGLELHLRAIVGSAKLCWVLDIYHARYFRPGFLSKLDSELRRMNAIQTSLNDWVESGRRTLLYSLGQSLWSPCSPEEPSEASIPSYAVVVSALALLSLVYQYLTGNVDRGGSKAYSRSSLDFRDVYVSTVLFLGAYVWIKFREVARKGVHPRKLVDRQGGTKVVYAARLTPPMWNGKKLPRLDLGRFATPQEAHNKFLIAAFYYNRGAGLLDGWFQVPPMSEKERSLAGLEKRKWVIGQAKKVYEDFKTGAEAEAALLVQELLETGEDQVTPEQHEVNADFSMVSLLKSAEHQQPALASQAENRGMGMGMIGDNHGLECASHSFGGMHEGLAFSNGHNLGCQEAYALPASQLPPPPNTESGMSVNGSDQLDILRRCVHTQQQQIYLQQQQISIQQQQIQGFAAQILQLQRQQRNQQQQQFQESWVQNPQWPCQFGPQQQQLQDINDGVPSFEVEMEQSMHQQNYLGFMTLPHDGGEIQEAFSELDALVYM